MRSGPKYKQSRHRDWEGVGELSGNFVGIIRRNAKKRGLKFRLSKRFLWNLFLKQKRKCALSGIGLRFPTNGKTPDGTASLDRINGSKGYGHRNVRWVHKDINFMKRTLSDKDFLDFCEKVCNTAKRENHPLRR